MLDLKLFYHEVNNVKLVQPQQQKTEEVRMEDFTFSEFTIDFMTGR